MCRDGALIQEKVADKASFDKRCKEILQLYAGNSSFSSNVRLVNPNQAILAYEYQKKRSRLELHQKNNFSNRWKRFRYLKYEITLELGMSANFTTISNRQHQEKMGYRYKNCQRGKGIKELA